MAKMMDYSTHNSRQSQSGFCMCCKVWRMWCWRAFKWIPVLLISSIVAWSYYAYVIALCIFTLTNTVQQCVYLILFHILLFMFIWSYTRTIFAVIQPVPERYKLPEAEIEKLLSAESEEDQRSILENFAKELPIVTRLLSAARKYLGYPPNKSKKEILEGHALDGPVLTRTTSGSVRYCNRCVLIKPDRAHHCSICARCVLKMDHHCPWVNNCVCYFNYKFFMLFLGYALLYCLFIMGTCLPYFIKFWKVYNLYTSAHCDRMFKEGVYSKYCVDLMKGEMVNAATAGRYHIVFAFFVSLMFAISLGSLFGYHCYLVMNNRTTLDMLLLFRRYGNPVEKMVNSVMKIMIVEAFRAPMFRGGADKNGFSIGAFNNFKEVFGNRPNLWLVPVFTSLGDGCNFPVRREHELQAFTAPPPEPHGYESMGTTRSSFGDGIEYPLPAQEEDTESLLSSERWERWGRGPRPFDERESSSYDEL